MRLKTQRLKIIALGALLAGLGACADELPDRSPTTATQAPQLRAISSDRLVVGETVEFFGEHFADGEAGTTRIHLQGEFVDHLGERHPVDLFVPTVYGGHEVDADGAPGRDILTWSRFGPFANPFTQAAHHGRFEGTATPVVEASDGAVLQGSAVTLALTVGPSIIIEGLEPLEAACGAPAVRGLPGIPYRLRVRTTGIKATRFVYEIAECNGQALARYEHDFGRDNPVAEDVVGEEEPVIFNPIPDERQSYVAGLRITAYDDEGNAVETALPFSLHRPMEVIYDGKQALAERYDPVPVSGCIPGGVNSQVEYSETRSESRQQSVSVTVSNSWSSSDSRRVSSNLSEGISTGESRSRSLEQREWEGESLSEGYGLSYSQNESNNVGFSTTDGETWNFDMSEGESNEEYASRMNELFGEGSIDTTVGAKASGSVPGFAKVTGSVSTSVGVTAGARTRGSEGGRARTSTSRGYGMGGSSSQGSSFGSTVAEGRSESVEGTYALSSNRSRTARDEASERRQRTWSFGSGVALEDVATTGETEAIDQTWVQTDATSLRQGFTATIPRNKIGIFYRQTTRMVRRAEVRSYDLCGLASHVGELQFNEWIWAADLAIGNTCDSEPPPSGLPEARCFIPPCGG